MKQLSPHSFFFIKFGPLLFWFMIKSSHDGIILIEFSKSTRSCIPSFKIKKERAREREIALPKDEKSCCWREGKKVT